MLIGLALFGQVSDLGLEIFQMLLFAFTKSSLCRSILRFAFLMMECQNFPCLNTIAIYIPLWARW